MSKTQCCGPGSGIRCLFDPWPPGSRMGKKSGSGPGINNPDHISESLETIFCVKILKFFDADPGWKKFESGIKIRNTVHMYIKGLRQETKKFAKFKYKIALTGSITMPVRLLR
jgi:hypothetical protein